MSATTRMIAAATIAPLCLAMTACSGAGQAPAADPAQDQTLTVWAWDPNFNIYALTEAEKIYRETHPDFRLDIVETPWDDLQPKLTTIAQAGQTDQLPDIFLMQNYSFEKNVVNYPDIFSPIDGAALDFDEFPASVVASSTVDGAHYGVPFDSGTAITALRTDVLAQAGYTIDDFTDITWEDFIAKGKDVLAATGMPLLSTTSGNSDLVMMIMGSAGAGLFDAQGAPTIAGNDTLLDVAAIYKELIDSGVLVIVNSWDEYIGSFVNGSVAGTMNGVWIAASIQTAQDQAGQWAITNVPRLDSAPAATNYTSNGGSSWAISANANVDLATDFLASTFAGSVDFYNTILPKSGAIANWTPAAGAPAYTEPQEFFGGQAIYAQVVDYGGKVPTAPTGVYHTEGRDAVNTALTKIADGGDPVQAFAEAQATVEFAMK
ncbi:extracellular solute-binding protein [Actinomyces sp. B33]|uniref:ABC transporter substrate-binding protein n=1 Tax=Actinomyces sp. B33 TaxID=2942131 RepID=UPI002340391C|nr:extracellular solute-binding protein [Actinomyces sp. B33]MDC4233674.1 extracellular solute-binding protein [Actinomyces sp. B33]